MAAGAEVAEVAEVAGAEVAEAAEVKRLQPTPSMDPPRPGDYVCSRWIPGTFCVVETPWLFGGARVAEPIGGGARWSIDSAPGLWTTVLTAPAVPNVRERSPPAKRRRFSEGPDS